MTIKRKTGEETDKEGGLETEEGEHKKPGVWGKNCGGGG